MITAKLANVLDIWILVFALLATSNTAASAEVDATRFGDAKVGGVSSQLRAVKQDDILHGAENSQRIGKDKPNIIWILLDACRVNLSCYGYERLTSPNIDKLASRGILFEQNFSQSTHTTVSAPSYMTGRYFPVEYLAGGPERALRPDDEQLLPEILERNGYETVMVTIAYSWFWGRDRFPKAFNEFLGVKPLSYDWGDLAMLPIPSFEELNAEVIRYLSRPHDKPFFVYLHTWDTHFPHHLVPPYSCWLDEACDGKRLQQRMITEVRNSVAHNFSEADKKCLLGLHDGSILYADAQIGVLVETLQKLDLLENTLIIICADHGETLGEDGKTVAHGGKKTYDEVTHVPLIMAGPRLPHGKRISHVTENVDIVPTLVDLLGLETDAKTDGKSLIPVIFDSDAPIPHQYAFVKTPIGPYGLIFSLRDNQFKYEYNLSTKDEHLYPIPDRVATRVDVLKDHPDVAMKMKRALFTAMGPRWKARQSYPLMAIFLDVNKILPKNKNEQAAIVSAVQLPTDYGKTDNKWLLSAGQLFSASFSEDAPQLSFHANVRNGKYRVLMEIYCSKDYAGRPASSLKVKLEGEPEFKTVTCDPREQQTSKYIFTELGVYNIQDGVFDAVVDEGDRSCWAGFKSFVLVARSRKAESEFARFFDWESSTQKEIGETLKVLESLGYVE